MPLHLVSISAILISMRTAISARSVRTFFLHLSLLLFGVVLETEDVYAAKKQIKENVTAETQVEVADIKSDDEVLDGRSKTYAL